MNDKVIKFISWNVNGLRAHIKRYKVLNYLKQKKADVMMLQETHLTERETFRIKDRWIGHTVHNTYNQKQRGVSILFSKHLKVQIQKEYKDEEGRIIIILVDILNQKLILSNIYAPNEDDPSFFYKVKTVLLDFGEFPVVWGGDFNQVLDGCLDKSGNYNPRTPKTQEAIKSVGEDLGVRDIWRLLNPTTRDYTFFSNRHSIFTRIYYFLLSHPLISCVTNCSIGTIGITDHAPVELVITTMV